MEALSVVADPAVNQFTAHQPVLCQEVLSFLEDLPAGLIIDCTLGGGGHAAALLEAFPERHLLALDRDTLALVRAKKRLEKYQARITFEHAEFSQVAAVVSATSTLATESVAAIFADLGYSSDQMDTAERGFSFAKSGPLDMRLDQTQELSAEQVLNQYAERELTLVFLKGSVGSRSRTLARRIIDRRPLESTLEFAQICEEVLGRGYKPNAAKRKHPATVPFQAVRIEVNQEYDQIRALLEQSLQVLCDHGRLLVIDFHSTEDKLVTAKMREWEREQRGKVLTKKAITPSEQEIAANSRARSARLRVFQLTSSKQV
ncbi:16S rRNA (cytosine(1402)-N(4))-methyltransferase RsmH [bacterium]|nr:16S rRNA (cytosine(1402)-N(4))-methyltransferase RsmH [bacterium]